MTFRTPRAAGQYEFRLFSGRSYTRLGVSDAFSVTGGDLEPPTAPLITGHSARTPASWPTTA